jgi:hypothetical protein
LAGGGGREQQDDAAVALAGAVGIFDRLAFAHADHGVAKLRH